MTTTTKTTDAAVAIYEVTVGDRRAFVRAANGTEAIAKYVRAEHPTAIVRDFRTYENEAGRGETQAHFSLSAGRSGWAIYATPIRILD